MVYYGGFYTMTEENWPLIGPMEVDDVFVVGALSGFGTMGKTVEQHLPSPSPGDPVQTFVGAS